jgi:hypothetical protein
MQATIIAGDQRRGRQILNIEGSRDEMWDTIWRARSLYAQVEWSVGTLSIEQAQARLAGSSPRPAWLRELMVPRDVGELMSQVEDQVDVARRRRRATA